MRLGLAANRLHHATEDAALFRWLRASGQGIRELGIELHAVGRTHDAIVGAGPLADYPALHRYPYGREGWLMKLVAEVVGMGSPERTLDGAIYFIDPVDPSSIFPEAIALSAKTRDGLSELTEAVLSRVRSGPGVRIWHEPADPEAAPMAEAEDAPPTDA